MKVRMYPSSNCADFGPIWGILPCFYGSLFEQLQLFVFKSGLIQIGKAGKTLNLPAVRASALPKTLLNS